MALLGLACNPGNVQVLQWWTRRPELGFGAFDGFEQSSCFASRNKVDGMSVSITGLEKPDAKRASRTARRQLTGWQRFYTHSSSSSATGWPARQRRTASRKPWMSPSMTLWKLPCWYLV